MNADEMTDELNTQIQYRLIEKLSESERRYRELVESLRVIVFKCDSSGCFKFLNRAWTETLGYNVAQSLSRPISSFLAPEDLFKGQLLLDQLQKQQVVICQELRFQHQTGTIVWLELSAHSSNQNKLGGSLINITDRKLAETTLSEVNEVLEIRVEQRTAELKKVVQDLHRTQTQMVQTEKMSSLGQLVAGVAHEINNPVNFIHGNLSYANQYIATLLKAIALYQQHSIGITDSVRAELETLDLDFLAEDLTKLLASMKVGSDRIRQIVLSLRNFSRLDEAEFKAVDIHEGIDSTLMILQHRIKDQNNNSGIQVIKQYGKLPMVECYAGQMNQVFMNLLTNAIDALEEISCLEKIHDGNLQSANWQPTITIGTELKVSDAFLDVDSVEIRIKDNGKGMPQDVIDRIFEPFFTTKPIGKGTGMGLSISYQVVSERHGGILQCISQQGSGTEFLVRIPMLQQEIPT